MSDLSWLPLMGYEALIIVGVVAIAIVFFKFGFRILLEHMVKVTEIKASASKGVLSEDISSQLKDILVILSAVSCDTQYSIFINKDADIYERLRAFRVLTAFAKNGDIRETGYKLILLNKPEWREVEKHKLKVPIIDQEHWDKTMNYINNNIFDVV